MAYPGYQPSKTAAFASGQTGAKRAQVGKKDLLRDLDREQTRKDYFKGRQDVSNDRLDRRLKQAQEYQDFKDTLKIAEGTTNLYQASKPVFDTDPSSPTFGQYVQTTLADKAMELANKYGPTFSEIGSDIGYGLGSIAKGFAEKGGPMISLFRGIGDKFKGGVKDAYDNLRNVFKGESQFTSQASKGPDINQPTQSQIVRELIEKSKNDSAFVPPTFDDQKIEVQQLPALLPPSQQGDATFRNDYPFLYDSRLDNLPFKAVPSNINDQTNFQKALANARVENTGLGLDSLKAAYDFARNPNLNTQYGNFSLDNVFTGNPQMNYGNTVMINGVPVDLSASIGQGGISGGLSFAFNKGGSVNKHSGLGYMLK
jgi:hypothetical protein